MGPETAKMIKRGVETPGRALKFEGVRKWQREIHACRRIGGRQPDCGRQICALRLGNDDPAAGCAGMRRVTVAKRAGWAGTSHPEQALKPGNGGRDNGGQAPQ